MLQVARLNRSSDHCIQMSTIESAFFVQSAASPPPFHFLLSLALLQVLVAHGLSQHLEGGAVLGVTGKVPHRLHHAQ